MSPPRKDLFTNQYITRNITKKDTMLPTLLEKGHTGNKLFIDDTHVSNKTENEHNNYTDN